MATKDTLTPEDWIKAAFRLLTSAGPKAIRVDYLCRELSVTKGSFYWHFADLAALRAAMVEHWRRVATRDVIASMSVSGPTFRLHDEAVASATELLVEAATEVSHRLGWGHR